MILLFKIKKKIEKLIYYFQIPLFLISFYFFKLISIFSTKSKKKILWVIGVSEIASNIYFLSKIIKPSLTVCLDRNPFYNHNYDFSINVRNVMLKYIYRIFYGPILLGYLANKATHFFYIWATGFLLDREYEFKFLKSKNKKIVCMFCGNDIRSPKLSMELAKKLEIDYFVEYTGYRFPYYLTDEYDNEKKRLAEIADKYADLIFSAQYDQISYLKSKQYHLPYMYDKAKFCRNDSKFKDLSKSKIKILHAPSDPLPKGTPLVRAAIKKLKLEGYDFDYIELKNVPNEVVLEHLKSAHIVLNQFYSFVPGLFGIEAMANHCAVLMSADPNIEKGLPQDSKDAWLITKYWEVYDNLKYLLDNPEKIKYYADNGYEFAYKHYTFEAAEEYINKVLKENGIIP